jgi:hypothetical protein
MMQACVKNTFLELRVQEDSSSDVRPNRSRSAEDNLRVSRPETSFDLKPQTEVCLTRLNTLLQSPVQRPPLLDSRVLEVTDEQTKSPAPSVDELRLLQKRLSEAACTRPKLGPTLGLGGKRIHSSSSVSTMAPEFQSDCEDLTIVPNIRKAWSSGSVSSMAGSEFFEEAYEEGGFEFDPIFEEEVAVHQHEAYQAKHVTTSQRWPQQCPRIASARDGTKAEFCHGLVPKHVNLAEKFEKTKAEGPPTTMMIRNIPNRYTQKELMRELSDLGFSNSYDFLYLPIDKGTLCNVGYAFVNFVEPSWAQMCMRAFENYTFKKYRKARGKIATVSVAHLQGLEANLRHYENSAVNGMPRIKMQRGPVIIRHEAQPFD